MSLTIEYTDWDLCCGGLDPTTKQCQLEMCADLACCPVYTVEYQDFLVPPGSIIGPEQCIQVTEPCCGGGSGVRIGSGSGPGTNVTISYRDIWIPSCYIRPENQTICITNPTDCCPTEIAVPCCPGTSYPTVLNFVIQNANYSTVPPFTDYGPCRYENQVVPLTWNGSFWYYETFYDTTGGIPPFLFTVRHYFKVALVPCLLDTGTFNLGVGFSFAKFPVPIGPDPVNGSANCTTAVANIPSLGCSLWLCPTRPVFLTKTGVQLYYHNTSGVGNVDECVFPTGPAIAPLVSPSWTFDAVIFE